MFILNFQYNFHITILTVFLSRHLINALSQFKLFSSCHLINERQSAAIRLGSAGPDNINIFWWKSKVLLTHDTSINNIHADQSAVQCDLAVILIFERSHVIV